MRIMPGEEKEMPEAHVADLERNLASMEHRAELAENLEKKVRECTEMKVRLEKELQLFEKQTPL